MAFNSFNGCYSTKETEINSPKEIEINLIDKKYENVDLNLTEENTEDKKQNINTNRNVVKAKKDVSQSTCRQRWLQVNSCLTLFTFVALILEIWLVESVIGSPNTTTIAIVNAIIGNDTAINPAAIGPITGYFFLFFGFILCKYGPGW
jgi:hypothetical protein